MVSYSPKVKNKKYNRWNNNPPLLTGAFKLPPIPKKAKEEILDQGLFKVNMQANAKTGAREFIPQSYIPLHNLLFNGDYLAACDLTIERLGGS